MQKRARRAEPAAMSPPWDDLRSALAGMGESFGADAVRDLQAEGGANAADALVGAIAGDPGAGARAAAIAWARLKTGVGWTTPAWRECYVIGQLREATEAGEQAAALEGSTRAAERDALLRRAMLAADMAHVMGAPGETARPFARAVETSLKREAVEESRGDHLEMIPDALPAALAPSIDPAHALERRDSLTRKEFKREFFNKDKPVALGAVGARWPALDKWRDLRWLKKQHGHRNVPLEVGAFDDKAWREDVRSLASFVDEFLAPSARADARAGAGVESASDLAAPVFSAPSNADANTRRDANDVTVAYLAQHQLFEQIPDLLADFDAPEVCDAFGGADRVNAWIGTRGTVTPCHFDSYDNVLGQVAGFKFVRLYHEKDAPFMYRHAGAWETNRTWPGSQTENEAETLDDRALDHRATTIEGDVGGTLRARGAQGNISRVDVERPDHEKFPLFANARHMDVVLGPGEFVYIPARCWHYVRALTTSVSLNFLF